MKIQLVASSFPFVKLIAEYDRFHFLWQQADKLAVERRFILAVRVVARKILAFVERSRFKKLRKGLVLIQSCIRRRKAKKWLYYLRRNQIRVVILYFTNLPYYLVERLTYDGIALPTRIAVAEPAKPMPPGAAACI